MMSDSSTLSGKVPSDYQEILYWRIAERSGRTVMINLLSIPLALVFGFVFFNVVRLLGEPPDVISIDLAEMVLLLGGTVLLFIVHEVIHGLAMRQFGARPKYGVIWKGLMIYAAAPGFAFARNQYLVIGLAPLVSLSIVACLGILLQAGTANIWFWAVWATINGGASIGDLWITMIVLRYPAHAYIVDERDGMRVFLPKRETHG